MQISTYEDYKTREGTRRVGRGPMRRESRDGTLGWELEGRTEDGKKRDRIKTAAV